MFAKNLLRAGLLLGLLATTSLAQTEGTVKLSATIRDMTARSSTEHYTVVWVTKNDGTFIKTLWKQGPGFSDSEWGDHCQTWNTARGGSREVIDGFSSGTAFNYTSTANNPIDPVWDCLDGTKPFADGNYRIFIQYAERDGQGPVTSALVWTKGTSAFSQTYPDQGTTNVPSRENNFTDIEVIWTPALVAPTITSSPPPSPWILGAAYTPYACTATGTAPIEFTATGLPPGLSISTAGEISGTPTVAGSFPGTITASNVTGTDATQAFTITIAELLITSVEPSGSNLLINGTGPAGSAYTILSSPDPSEALNLWSTAATGTFDGSGQFSAVSVPVAPGVKALYYRLQVP